MQQTKSYWRFVAVAGVVSAFVASACVVTTDDPDLNNKAGAGGSGATAGSTTSGGSTTTGGSSTTGGSTSHAGTSAGGAAPADDFMCDDQNSLGGAPGEGTECKAMDPNDKCGVCIQNNCCEEYGACRAINPNNQCAFGGPKVDGKYQEGGEIACMHQCLIDLVAKSMISATEDDKRKCAGQCTTDACDPSSLGFQTSELIGCMDKYCTTECWGPN